MFMLQIHTSQKHHKKCDKKYHIEKGRFGTFLKKDSLNNYRKRRKKIKD